MSSTQKPVQLVAGELPPRATEPLTLPNGATPASQQRSPGGTEAWGKELPPPQREPAPQGADEQRADGSWQKVRAALTAPDQVQVVIDTPGRVYGPGVSWMGP